MIEATYLHAVVRNNTAQRAQDCPGARDDIYLPIQVVTDRGLFSRVIIENYNSNFCSAVMLVVLQSPPSRGT